MIVVETEVIFIYEMEMEMEIYKCCETTKQTFKYLLFLNLLNAPNQKTQQ